jgi:hypothetical protein
LSRHSDQQDGIRFQAFEVTAQADSAGSTAASDGRETMHLIASPFGTRSDGVGARLAQADIAAGRGTTDDNTVDNLSRRWSQSTFFDPKKQEEIP